MNQPVIHPLTKRQLEAFASKPAHAIILAGVAGSGKRSIAIDLVEKTLNLAQGSFDTYSYGQVVNSDGGKAIGIEAIRALEHFLSLKVPSRHQYNRAVIIEDSHLLTTEAQNALLKTLEEPPAGTIIVLTANSEQALLPTIRSRGQLIKVLRPDRVLISEYFGQQGLETKQIEQAYAISGGLPGLMTALLSQTDHPLLGATERVRQLLSQSTYERLLSVDELAKQRDLASDMLFILQQMSHVSLQTTQGKLAVKWQAILEASYAAAQALSTSAQPKLVLTNLMLRL